MTLRDDSRHVRIVAPSRLRPSLPAAGHRLSNPAGVENGDTGKFRVGVADPKPLP
jgi:hypothetical protein